MSNDSQSTAVASEVSTGRSSASFTALIASTALAFTIILDQLSKAIIWKTVGPAGPRLEIDVVPGLQIIFVRNTGSAFGMFQGQSSILTALTFVALAFLAVFFYRNARQDPIAALSLGLIVGGAVGNLIDRIRLGYVIDWIDVPRWPTFNIADSAITVGVTLLMVTILFRDSDSSDVDEEDHSRETLNSRGVESGSND